MLGCALGDRVLLTEARVYMGQQGTPRPHPSDPRQGLCEVRVRWMRLAPEAVDNPQFDAFSRGERRIVEFGDVGRVRKTADPQPEGSAEAMVLGERDDRDPGDLERASDLVRLEGRLVKAARLERRLEHIAKAPADLAQGPRIGKD